MRIKWRQSNRDTYVAHVHGYTVTAKWCDDFYAVGMKGPGGHASFGEDTWERVEHTVKYDLKLFMRKPFYVTIGTLKQSYLPLRDYRSINLSKLRKHVKKKGIMRPLLVTHNNDGDLTIVDGVCRYMVASVLKLRTVPCTIYAEGD